MDVCIASSILYYKMSSNKSLHTVLTQKGLPWLIDTQDFIDQSALRKHARGHGVKRFVCDHCGKAFVDRSKLKRHMLVRHDEGIAYRETC